MTAEDEDLDKIDELSSKFNNLQNDVENSKKKLDENKNKYEELKAQLDDDEEVCYLYFGLQNHNHYQAFVVFSLP